MRILSEEAFKCFYQMLKISELWHSYFFKFIKRKPMICCILSSSFDFFVLSIFIVQEKLLAEIRKMCFYDALGKKGGM